MAQPRARSPHIFPATNGERAGTNNLAEIEVASAQAMSVILAWDINNGDDISKLVAAEAPWQAFRFPSTDWSAFD